MRLLTLDTGVSTGVALVEGPNWKLTDFGEILLADLDNELWLHSKKGAPDVVIAERAANGETGQLGADLRKCENLVSIWFPEAIWIRPTDWKQRYKNLAKEKFPFRYPGGRLSAHAKDALHIAAYAIEQIIPKLKEQSSAS